MHALDLSVRSRSCPVEVLVIGHAAHKAPKSVEERARHCVAKECKSPVEVIDGKTTWILINPQVKSWQAKGELWRVVGNHIVGHLRSRNHTNANIHCRGADVEVSALVEGLVLGDYRFTTYKSGKAAKRPTLSLALIGADHKTVSEAEFRATTQNHIRMLVDEPGESLSPERFVEAARRLLKGSGAKIQVISGLKALEKAGFPGLALVGRSGRHAPCLLEITVPGKSKKGPSLALVGKGITFDSGGYAIKPAEDMWKMKNDMAGAAAVLGAAVIIAKEGAARPVKFYIPLAENLIGAQAILPGTIYKGRNGKFIHIDNPDAEGRLILGDVLTLACEKGATHIVDVATLTGACRVALGNHLAGLLANDTTWGQKVHEAGQSAGEHLWPLPLYGGYRESLDHPHADLNNIGGRYGGIITSALFLNEFIKPGVKWAHLDIAGPAFAHSAWQCYAIGSTGFSMRSLVELQKALGSGTV